MFVSRPAEKRMARKTESRDVVNNPRPVHVVPAVSGADVRGAETPAGREGEWRRAKEVRVRKRARARA